MTLSQKFYLCFTTCLLLMDTRCTASFDTDMTYIKICNETSPVTMRTMNEFLVNKRISGHNASNFKCFLHCLFTKYGWMDEEGGFLLHEVKKVLEEAGLEVATLEFVLYSCTAIHSVDKCERAYLFTECFWKKTAEAAVTEDDNFFNNLKKK